MPRKNLRQIGGLSLIGFKARSALRSKYCARLMISTDDPEIQAEAERHGVDVPFTRPAALATDDARSNDVILHAMDYLEQTEGRRYDAIMLLEPSSPFARAADYDSAIEMYDRLQAKCVLGMRETEVNSVFVGPLADDGNARQIIQKITGLSELRRQAMATEYTMNGALYLFDWDTMRSTGTLYGDPERSYGYKMDRFHSIEIDTMHDLKLAEFFVREGTVNMADWQ